MYEVDNDTKQKQEIKESDAGENFFWHIKSLSERIVCTPTTEMLTAETG